MASVPPPEPDKWLPTPGAGEEPEHEPEWQDDDPCEEPVTVPGDDEDEEWLP